MIPVDIPVKREIDESIGASESFPSIDAPSDKALVLIDLSSSGSESAEIDDSLSFGVCSGGKRPRISGSPDENSAKRQKLTVTLPPGFLEPLSTIMQPPVAQSTPLLVDKKTSVGTLAVQGFKQFWKAGDYEGDSSSNWEVSEGGMDHVRVHPKFLHSNATSHKWALGAFAELLDNALDEVWSGATHVNIDVLENKKDGSKMLLIEDNGGGMNPDKMRHCMSLGYSAKSKVANTIGQYGNGFKTSTMRLGADVLVFSRCTGQGEKRPTQSIGLLSYTFLRSTGKEDIIVPMLDYEREDRQWKMIQRSSAVDWNRNVETIVQWSPYLDEADLLQQFNVINDHGTRIIIYNLWEDDEHQLELDFLADKYDIQIRGVNRDEKNIQMAKQYPNSRHFLTYRHSLRSYVSILYLRLPPNFRIILRGKDVEHHNIVNDMMYAQEHTYRPQTCADGVPKDSNMFADVTIGFVKDAKFHIDVQGFNVYHKNRLIKPFWRLWNASGSSGRGVIGVLEANFVEPAHDKQGFERTNVLSRLEAKLIQMQKNYWSDNSHKIGYAGKGNKASVGTETSADHPWEMHGLPKYKSTNPSSKAPHFDSHMLRHKHGGKGFEGPPILAFDGHGNGHRIQSSSNVNGENVLLERRADGSSQINTQHFTNSKSPQYTTYMEKIAQASTRVELKTSDAHVDNAIVESNLQGQQTIQRLEEENESLKARLKSMDSEVLGERCKSLEIELKEANHKIEMLNKEQENIIEIFSEERDRRNIEEENLRKKLKHASATIQELLDKVKMMERLKSCGSQIDPI